jgi:ribose transport system ATP-binding protein
LRADQSLFSSEMGGGLNVPPTSKSFGGVRVLNEVAINLAAGEVRGLAGLNGSGKSTLVKLLAGYHRPDSPVTASVGERSFAVGDHVSANAVGLRFVHQDLALIVALNSVDNVGIGSAYSRRARWLIDWRRMRRRTSKILDDLGYSFDVDLPVESLTPSQRTGVAIARALCDLSAGAKVVVLDEPTASMPIPEVRNLFRAIDRLRSMGVAVILVTHRLDEILDMADTVSVLRNGSLVATEQVAGMTHSHLVELMLGRELAADATAPGRVVDGPVLLSVSGLSTSLIDGIALQLRQGEVLGIAGLTGSGREELLPAIFGIIPRSGDVMIGPRHLKPGRPPQAAAAGLGYVPAHRLRDGLFPGLTMTENFTIANLRSVSRRHLLSRSTERSQMQAWVAELAVSPPEPAAAILNLSGGNQQKIVVGRWARPGADVSVLLLDEPTQGVDVAARQGIYRAIGDFASRGGVMLSSSDTDELIRTCDRVLVLYEGRVAAELHGDGLTAEAVDGYCLGAGAKAA